MAKNFEQSPGELGMRVVLLVQEHAKRHPDFLMGDVALKLMREYGVCRATSFRYVRRAMDVLCLSYDVGEVRKRRIADRLAEGHAEAKLCGWPNGKPGPRARA